MEHGPTPHAAGGAGHPGRQSFVFRLDALLLQPGQPGLHRLHHFRWVAFPALELAEDTERCTGAKRLGRITFEAHVRKIRVVFILAGRFHYVDASRRLAGRCLAGR